MLDVMRSLNLDVAGEYLLMAATLAHLKSRELVPPDPAEEAALADEDDEDGLDPRQELIRRLLEYQKYKDAARQARRSAGDRAQRLAARRQRRGRRRPARAAGRRAAGRGAGLPARSSRSSACCRAPR